MNKQIFLETVHIRLSSTTVNWWLNSTSQHKAWSKISVNVFRVDGPIGNLVFIVKMMTQVN